MSESEAGSGSQREPGLKKCTSLNFSTIMSPCPVNEVLADGEDGGDGGHMEVAEMMKNGW